MTVHTHLHSLPLNSLSWAMCCGTKLWHDVSQSLLRPVLGNLDEFLEEVGGQGVFLAWPLWSVQLAVILDMHALAWVRMAVIILLIVIQFHIHPVHAMTMAMPSALLLMMMIASMNDNIDNDITAKMKVRH